ncbi:hypothetical protein JCM10908_003595 [Rhodotorula pacifica]|uniref:uncharacterized protein n=1 Tax=Rhodotorula pacifica TaxID=1495444 RepID=UPI00317AE287
MHGRRVFAAGAALWLSRAALAAPVNSGALPDSVVQLVENDLSESATDTWVAGTQMEALLELDYPSCSVFSSASYPPSSSEAPAKVQTIVKNWAGQRSSDGTQFAYVNGGAAADPAALGVGWLVAAAFADAQTNATYLAQVKQEVGYLLNSVPRTQDGAISHRPPGEPVSLWADFISMVPPFLAYYSVATADKSYLSEAYDQIKLYRSYLKSDSGAWKHIVLGDGQDAGLWNTGNGWAAHGSLRVLATMKNSQWSADFTTEIADLTSWVQEILGAALQKIKRDGLLPNYYDSASGSYFSDASGSALLAASAYRLAQIANDSSFVSKADTVRTAVFAAVSSSTGWVASVVDPLSFKAQASESPEAEAFVLLLQAAYRDYLASPAATASP